MKIEVDEARCEGVRAGQLDPPPLADLVISLADVAEGCKAVDSGSALKVIVDARRG